MKLPSLNLSLLSRFSYGKRIFASRDWLILIAAAALLLLGSATWNAWTFFKVLEGKPLGEPVLAPSLSPESVTGAKELIEERAKEEARYRSDYTLIDPS